MPGRVNVKFVVLLSVVLLLVFGGVAGAVLWVVSKSGEDYAKLAMQREAEGDWEAAARSWSLAVSHNQDNIEWLQAWLNAQQQIIPETRLDYNQAFNDKYINILRQMADLQRTNVEAHDRYLSERRMQLAGGFNASNEEFFLTEVGRILGYFAAEPEDGDWNRLRAYRGNSIVRLITNRLEQPQERVELALEDLEAALSIDPSHTDAFTGLVSLHQFRGETARRERRFEAETQELDKARDVIDAFNAANPRSPLGAAVSLRLELARGLAAAERDASSEELPAVRSELAASLQPQLADLIELVANSDLVNLQSASITVSLIGGLDSSRLIEDGRRVWEAAQRNHPDDVAIEFALAEFLRQTGERELALDVYGEIAARPNEPVSADGLLLFGYRDEAAYRQAVTALEMWETTDSEAEKTAKLEQAREFEKQLLETRSATDPQMLLLGAKFAVAENDYNLADRQLRQFNQATGSANAEALRLTGLVAQRQGNPGAARDAFRQALTIEPTNVFSQIALAEVEQALGRTDMAIDLLTTVSQQQPNNDRIQTRLNQLLMLAGRVESDDPETAIRIEAERLRLGGDTAGYIAALERGAVQFPQSVVFHASLARAYLQQGRRDVANTAIDRALAISPDDSALQRLKMLVSGENPVEDGIRILESDESLSAVELALRKFQLYNSAGERALADEQLDRAIELAPDSPDVLRPAFDRAIRNGDSEGARALLPAVKSSDLDGAGGRTFEARVLLIEDRTEEAENLVRASIAQGATNAESYTLLGRILESQGRVAPAIDAFEQAYAIRPNDVGILNSLLDGLIRQRQLPRALEVARSALGTARTNAAFRQRWLLLEGQVGNREQALQERLSIAESSPDDAENSRQIIVLLLDLGRYGEARQRIDQARADDDSFALAGLDARWHADRNDMNSARAVFVDYLVENEESLDGPQPYLAFGQFLIERRDVRGGLSAIQQAIRFQEDGEYTAQLFLGMQLFQLGRNEEAAEVYEEIVSGLAGAESSDARLPSIRARLAEVYVRLNRFEDAQRVLTNIPEEEANDLTMRLLRADIAAGTGDSSTASTLLNEAIANSPDSTIALLKRAQFRHNRGDTDDALADLEQVLEVDPRSVGALRLRATIRYAQGDTRLALADLQSAVEAAPEDTQLRLLAVGQLITEGRPDDAADIADVGIRRSPSDLGLKLGTGDLFQSNNAHRRAATYFAQAWEQSKSLAVAQRYVDALLSRTPADTATARQVAENRELARTNADAAVAMLRARVAGADEQYPQAWTLALEALQSIGDNPAQLSGWVDALPEIFGDRDRAGEYLSRLEPPQATLWTQILVARYLASERATRSQGIERLQSLRARAASGLQTEFIVQSIAIAQIGAEDFRGAEATLREALAQSPNSPELLNNLAFVLATELNEPAEALELAEQAAELAPDSPGVLDTLGFIRLEAGDAESALATLQRAADLAGPGLESLPIRINLARALLRTGDRGAAERLAERLESAVDSDDAIREQYGDRLEKLQEELRRG